MEGEYEEKYKSDRGNFSNACADDCNPLLMPTMSRRRIILEWFRQALWPTNLKKVDLLPQNPSLSMHRSSTSFQFAWNVNLLSINIKQEKNLRIMQILMANF